ncbi:hypothetical protein EAE32_02890 [Kocuria tytonicola]|uniref:Uncharacterized protein n=1 Tax=Kocuria tytonicola TaxID=2055946 RepID=A0A3L9LCQ4_9MICC|nr:hypothetical protein EAE32_02890 [Kocuria tytonicola]
MSSAASAVPGAAFSASPPDDDDAAPPADSPAVDPARADGVGDVEGVGGVVDRGAVLETAAVPVGAGEVGAVHPVSASARAAAPRTRRRAGDVREEGRGTSFLGAPDARGAAVNARTPHPVDAGFLRVCAR